MRADLRDRTTFAAQIDHDRLRVRRDPTSCWRAARQGRAARLRRELRPGRRAGLVVRTGCRRRARPRHPAADRRPATRSRSAFLTSPTFGARQLARALDAAVRGCGSTASSATASCSRGDRMTLDERVRPGGLAHRLRRRPPTPRTGREGRTFYRFDQLYDSRNVGYRGPKFGYAPMPDQYTLAAFRRPRAGAGRPAAGDGRDRPGLQPPPVDAAARASSPWDEVGDGSVYDGMPRAGPDARARCSGTRTRSGGCTASRSSTPCAALISFLTTYRDPNLVVVVLGDHQPHSYVSGAARRPRRAGQRDRPGPGGAWTRIVRLGLAGRAAALARTHRSGGWTRSATGSSPPSGRPPRRRRHRSRRSPRTGPPGAGSEEPVARGRDGCLP